MTDVDVRSSKKGVDITLHAKWVVIASAFLTSGYFIVTNYFGNEAKQDAKAEIIAASTQAQHQTEDARYMELIARLKTLEENQNRTYDSVEQLKRFLMNRNASLHDGTWLAMSPISEFESH